MAAMKFFFLFMFLFFEHCGSELCEQCSCNFDSKKVYCSHPASLSKSYRNEYFDEIFLNGFCDESMLSHFNSGTKMRCSIFGMFCFVLIMVSFVPIN